MFANGKNIVDVSEQNMMNLIHEFIELFLEALVLERADVKICGGVEWRVVAGMLYLQLGKFLLWHTYPF
jgi:hypothetical protein